MSKGSLKLGTLTGVGVGPGAPDLLTLRAVKAIKTADVIAYPAPIKGQSLALSIAQPFIGQNINLLEIELPMSIQRTPAQNAYDEAEKTISSHLDAQRNVAFLCEGDPLFYGSFMYLSARLSSTHPINIIPGITSICATAAAANWPLCARNEPFTVLPAPLDEDTLGTHLNQGTSFAIMKVGRHLPKIRDLIKKHGVLESAVYIERASHPNEYICPLKDAPEHAPYFSMILLRKGQDPWL